MQVVDQAGKQGPMADSPGGKARPYGRPNGRPALSQRYGTKSTSLPTIERNYTLVGAIGNILKLFYCIIIMILRELGDLGEIFVHSYYALGE